jgi:hypothetical protein
MTLRRIVSTKSRAIAVATCRSKYAFEAIELELSVTQLLNLIT